MTRPIVFAGAWLLFLVQPLFARLVLPTLGASAQTWNTCMVFFQVTLLLGYAYAHLLVRRLRFWWTVPVHLGVVALGLAALPLGFDPGVGPPPEGSPVPWLLGVLTRQLGLPFFALAATNPLVQRWLAESTQEGAHDPYFLFAASNAGSLAALLAYPLLVEPLTTLRTQRHLWSAGYGLFVAALAVAAARLFRRRRRTPATRVEGAAPGSAEGGRRRWLALSFVPSSLLLGVTAHLANEVPSMALLWTLPLFLYLLSFALTFPRRPPIPHRAMVAVHPLLLTLLAVVLFVPTRVSGFSIHLAALFVSAMVLHGELARLRPAPGRLTEYYLWIAAGGALGGVFNALVAPRIFPFVAELPLALVAACLLHPGTAPSETGPWPRRLDAIAPGLLVLGTWTLMGTLPWLGDFRDTVVRLAILLVAGMVAHWFRARPLRFGLSVAAVLAGGFMGFQAPGTLALDRSYYGAYRVTRHPSTGRTLLHHGSTVQGSQEGPAGGGVPGTYYHPDTSIGRLLRRRLAPQDRLAGIGLGVGALAWYLKPGQRLRFFELDPMVRDLAQDPRLFRFLAESRGQVEVIVGDGRLSMQREPEGGYQLIFLDAFSSDAVPVHLLTREALEIYLRRLAPGGVLVFHATNRHVRVDAVVGALARARGLVGRGCVPAPLTRAESARGVEMAQWLLLTRRAEELERWVGDDPCWQPVAAEEGVPVWSDDHTSMLPVLRW